MSVDTLVQSAAVIYMLTILWSHTTEAGTYFISKKNIFHTPWWPILSLKITDMSTCSRLILGQGWDELDNLLIFFLLITSVSVI